MRVRSEKVAIKDIKLRTFIAEGNSRNDLAAHVYDITYGSIEPFIDNLVVIDDSIVRGTTLRQSIIGILDRLHPKKIVIVSSSPQVRYPDYYGIDMSRMNEFIAFKAAVALLRDRGMEYVILDAYQKAKRQQTAADGPLVNYVKEIYAPFTDEEISVKMVELLTPAGTQAKVEIVYQTLEGLHASCPEHPGDWYFVRRLPDTGRDSVSERGFYSLYGRRIFSEMTQHTDSMQTNRTATLMLDDGTVFRGYSFGYERPVAGEVVFNTAMTGYPESLTDPSYAGQLMVLTYPLVGNYGVPPRTFEPNGIATFMESEKIHAEAIIVSDYSHEYSHWNAECSLGEWLKEEKIPGIYGIDTRALTKKLREHGVMMGRIVIGDADNEIGNGELKIEDYEHVNYVDRVSCKEIICYLPDGTSQTCSLLEASDSDSRFSILNS